MAVYSYLLLHPDGSVHKYGTDFDSPHESPEAYCRVQDGLPRPKPVEWVHVWNGADTDRSPDFSLRHRQRALAGAVS